MKHVQKGFTSPSQDGAENEKARNEKARKQEKEMQMQIYLRYS